MPVLSRKLLTNRVTRVRETMLLLVKVSFSIKNKPVRVSNEISDHIMTLPSPKGGFEDTHHSVNCFLQTHLRSSGKRKQKRE